MRRLIALSLLRVVSIHLILGKRVSWVLFWEGDFNLDETFIWLNKEKNKWTSAFPQISRLVDRGGFPPHRTDARADADVTSDDCCWSVRAHSFDHVYHNLLHHRQNQVCVCQMCQSIQCELLKNKLVLWPRRSWHEITNISAVIMYSVNIFKSLSYRHYIKVILYSVHSNCKEKLWFMGY